jgi:hypothetical protein
MARSSACYAPWALSKRTSRRMSAASADYADLVVMPTLVLDRLRGKGMRVIWSA